AARLLGIHRNTLRRKLEAYQLPGKRLYLRRNPPPNLPTGVNAMKRTKRGARWLLGMVCAVAVSCTDSPTAVAPDGDAPGGLDALATHAAGSNANGRGQLASVTTGTPAHANGNG